MGPISHIFGVVSQGFVRFGGWLKGLPARVAAFAKEIFSRESSQSALLSPGRAKRLDGPSGTPEVEAADPVDQSRDEVTGVTKRARETASPEPSQNAPEAGSAGIEQIQRYPFNNLITPLLSTKDVASLSKTSRAMKNKVGPILDQRWEAEKAAITIDAATWKQVGFEVNEVPPLPENIDAILKAECPYFKGKRVYQTHRLLLMPAGLSMNKQGVLTRHLREGENENIFLHIWYRITAELLDREVKEPYWILVTKDVIPGSRYESFKNQIKLLKPGYQLPTILEATTLVTMNLEKSGERREYLLPEEPLTFTQCIEKIDGFRLVVGCFSRSGLYVNREVYGPNDTGVVGLRKL